MAYIISIKPYKISLLNILSFQMKFHDHHKRKDPSWRFGPFVGGLPCSDGLGNILQFNFSSWTIWNYQITNNYAYMEIITNLIIWFLNSYKKNQQILIYQISSMYGKTYCDQIPN